MQKKLPYLFEEGGVFYNAMKKDVGLANGKHFTLPHLPGKTFVYNGTDNRLELCIDPAGHIPIGPDIDNMIKEALSQLRSEGGPRSREGSPSSHGGMKLGSGGVVRKKSEQMPNVTAFQGKGHSLGTASSSPQLEQRHSREMQMHRKQSTGTSSATDLNCAIGKSSPKQEASPPKSSGGDSQLIRMAPGFVTMRDGRQLDPNLVEAQRKKLQEMVSSIQASMDKHLRDQSAEESIPSDIHETKMQYTTSSVPLVTRTEGPQTDAPQQEPGTPQVGDNENLGMETTTGVELLSYSSIPSCKVQDSTLLNEDLEEMDSQEIEGTVEPMDHS